LKKTTHILIILTALSLFTTCKKDKPEPDAGTMQLQTVSIGGVNLSPQDKATGIAVNPQIQITFDVSLDTSTVRTSLSLKKTDNSIVPFLVSYENSQSSINISPVQNLEYLTDYNLTISPEIKGADKQTFPGVSYIFSTQNGFLTIENITLNGSGFKPPVQLKEIPTVNSVFVIDFSHPLDPANYQSFFNLTTSPSLTFILSNENKKLTITVQTSLSGYSPIIFSISPDLTAANDFSFNGFSNTFITSYDPTPKFPLISDDALLTLVQEQTFKFFWDYAHPVSGMARERLGSGDIVTSGGSGFGIMSLIVGTERGFITRPQVLERMDKILDFLETCDRFHGAWSHWINGTTGKVVPFGSNDNGADLVETAFLVQGLLAFRQYMNVSVPAESAIIDRINTLWRAVEWDWFARGGETLYWHWSPDKGWIMNMQIRGVNETLITYFLGIASPTHPIPVNSYKSGYMLNGSVVNGKTFYGYKLPIGYDYGGPMFLSHYSFLGLDPRNLKDQYVDYAIQTTNHTLINRAYCIANPRKYPGYSENSWGLTASDNQSGYNAHSPTNDLGVISPTAALSSMPFAPTECMAALKFFYYTLGDKLWGTYGFYDAFNVSAGWWAGSYIAIDQGPIIVMIENHRTQLIWNLFMSCPEIKTSLTSVGFTY